MFFCNFIVIWEDYLQYTNFYWQQLIHSSELQCQVFSSKCLILVAKTLKLAWVPFDKVHSFFKEIINLKCFLFNAIKIFKKASQMTEL